MRLFTKSLIAFAAALTLAPAVASASGGETRDLKHNHWHFNGINGSYDQGALQRGFQVYREVCASCHSIDLVAFRNLADEGGPFYLKKCPEVLIERGLSATTDCSNPTENPIVKQLAAEYEIEDGPDDGGDMFMRAGLPSDYIPSPYINKQQAAAANGGALPPDFSLLAKARHHGPDYIYSLLSGFEDAPEIIAPAPGQYYNPYFPGDVTSLLKPEYLDEEGHLKEGFELPEGGVLAMNSPLADGIVEYTDGSPMTVDQYSKDVAEFMMWAAEPKMAERKKMGLISMFYLFIFAGIVYASYKQIWSNVEH